MNAADEAAAVANTRPWVPLGITEEAYRKREATAAAALHPEAVREAQGKFPLRPEDAAQEQPRTRKRRSDAGKPRPVSDVIEIRLRVGVEDARRIALILGDVEEFSGYAQSIQDEIIDQLAKELNRLRK